jgi:single-stranded-DNA-specific exonuclease
VDCGITAEAEARLCRSLGVDLVITDHHECKGSLPEAAAVVDPHRPDRRLSPPRAVRA